LFSLETQKHEMIVVSESGDGEEESRTFIVVAQMEKQGLMPVML
jgi:hypothetical protein